MDKKTHAHCTVAWHILHYKIASFGKNQNKFSNSCTVFVRFAVEMLSLLEIILRPANYSSTYATD